MKVIYLIQSDRPTIPYSIPNGSDVLLLQWKENFITCEDSFHYPNSSWASGRNELLKRAKEKGDYDYYIFLDDDLKLYFSLEAFEKKLIKYKLKRIVPFLIHHIWYKQAKGELERVKYADHAFMAFRKDCIKTVFPYTLEHDKTCWWLASENNCECFWEKYPEETLRLNHLVYINQENRPYPRTRASAIPKNTVSAYNEIDYEK